MKLTWPGVSLTYYYCFTIALFSNSEGNAQGKYQRHSEVEGNKDYLQAPLWDGSPVEITVPPAGDGKNLCEVQNYKFFL